MATQLLTLDWFLVENFKANFEKPAGEQCRMMLKCKLGLQTVLHVVECHPAGFEPTTSVTMLRSYYFEVLLSIFNYECSLKVSLVF